MSPVLFTMSPAQSASGGPAVNLTASGVGFTRNDVVTFNAAALSTTYVSSTTLTAVIPARNAAYTGHRDRAGERFHRSGALAAATVPRRRGAGDFHAHAHLGDGRFGSLDADHQRGQLPGGMRGAVEWLAAYHFAPFGHDE